MLPSKSHDKMWIGRHSQSYRMFLILPAKTLKGCQEPAAKQGCPRVALSTHKHHIPTLDKLNFM